MRSGTFGRRRLGAAVWELDIWAPDIWAPDIWAPRLSGARFYFWHRFSVATLFRLVARFARVRIEDSSLNRFALNGI